MLKNSTVIVRHELFKWCKISKKKKIILTIKMSVLGEDNTLDPSQVNSGWTLKPPDKVNIKV